MEIDGGFVSSKVLLVIPAYNEVENIINTVERINKVCPQYDYVVVNDGSKDGTANVCMERGYNLVDLPINLGLAGAFQCGMKYAHKKGYDYAIQYDGDGQHNPQYIKDLVNAAQKDDCDIVIGSRFVSEKLPCSFRMIGSRIISLCVLLTTGKRIKDPTSGMRLYGKNLISQLAMQMNYGPEPDTVAFLLRCGARVSEIQVTMNERTAGQSYLNFSNAVKYMVRMCSSILIAQWFRKKVVICH